MSSRSRALVVVGITLACAGCLAVFDFDRYDVREPEPDAGNVAPDAQREAAPLPEDFALSVKPAARTLAPGDSASIALTISRGAGPESTVAFSVTGLPPGVTSNAQGLVAAAGSASAVLTISADARANLSSAPIVVHASDGQHEHAATIDLSVRGAPGTIDRGFGDGGVVTTALTGDVSPPELVLASDGGIVLGAGVSDPQERQPSRRVTTKQVSSTRPSARRASPASTASCSRPPPRSFARAA